MKNKDTLEHFAHGIALAALIILALWGLIIVQLIDISR